MKKNETWEEYQARQKARAENPEAFNAALNAKREQLASSLLNPEAEVIEGDFINTTPTAKVEPPPAQPTPPPPASTGESIEVIELMQAIIRLTNKVLALEERLARLEAAQPATEAEPPVEEPAEKPTEEPETKSEEPGQGELVP